MIENVKSNRNGLSSLGKGIPEDSQHKAGERHKNKVTYVEREREREREREGGRENVCVI